jgi:hypothetical protein
MMKPSLLIFVAAALALTACRKPQSEAAVDPPPPSVSLDAWFTSSAPPSPQAIHLVRDSLSPGDEVTVSGRIMGRKNPFVDDRAAFVLGDPAMMTPCNERPDDDCETPWDVCCDSRENVRLGTATIQLVGDDGRVIGRGLKGVNGLIELSTVTVTGTVDRGSTPEALIINATAVYVDR